MPDITFSLVNSQKVNFWIRDRTTQTPASKTISGEAKDHGLPTPMIMIPAP
jgi:hypothetical protein